MYYTYDEKVALDRRKKREAEIQAERTVALKAANASAERERQARLMDEATGLTEEAMRAKLHNLRAARHVVVEQRRLEASARMHGTMVKLRAIAHKI